MSRSQPAHIDATVYLQVEPTWYPHWVYDANGERVLEGGKVMRATQTRPDKPIPGSVVCKVTLRMPATAFLPLRPEAVVVVPEGMTEPITVEANDPHEEQE